MNDLVATAATLPAAELGRTGLLVSRLGLGAWAIGGGGWQGGWGPHDDDESLAAIRRALSLGINWIDTAAAYGLGHAEEVVGRAVRGLPAADRPLIFTKCGLVWRPGETTVSNVLAPASIRAECERSLRRLGVEAIDLYQIHWPSTDGTPVEDAWGTMAALVDEGLVRFIGVSNFDIELLERCQRIRQVDTVQPQLNLLVRDAAADVIPWARAHGTGVLVYSPMRSGLLSGRFTVERAANLPADDWRRADADFRSPSLDRSLALVEDLRPLATRLGATVAELAIAWTLAWPGVTAAIVGARLPQQVDGWVRAADIPLGRADLEAIANALARSGAGRGPLLPAS